MRQAYGLIRVFLVKSDMGKFMVLLVKSSDLKSLLVKSEVSYYLVLSSPII